MPVSRVGMCERIDNPVKCYPCTDFGILINIALIVEVYELMAERLAEYNPGENGKGQINRDEHLISDSAVMHTRYRRCHIRSSKCLRRNLARSLRSGIFENLQ